MFAIISALVSLLLSWFRPKRELALEVLSLRHQITVLQMPNSQNQAPLWGSIHLGPVEEMLARLENCFDDLSA